MKTANISRFTRYFIVLHVLMDAYNGYCFTFSLLICWSRVVSSCPTLLTRLSRSRFSMDTASSTYRVAGYNKHTASSTYRVAGYNIHTASSTYRVAGYNTHTASSTYRVAS